jgi:hypothetical protein
MSTRETGLLVKSGKPPEKVRPLKPAIELTGEPLVQVCYAILVVLYVEGRGCFVIQELKGKK